MNNFRLTFDITNFCNFNCIYCSLGIPYLKNKIYDKLSINDIKIIVMYVNMYLAKYNIICCIRGGEPTLHNEFDKIINELRFIKKLSNMILLTNGSIPLNTYVIDYSIFNDLRISVHVDIVANQSQYMDIILKNIIWLLENNITPSVHIMKSIKTQQNDLDRIFDIILNLFTTHNNNTQFIKIVDTSSTENYINDKFDYSKVDSMYNQKYDKPVYYCRAIKITPKMTWHYSCDLTTNISSPTNNLYSLHSWRYLQQNADKKIICKLPTCTCPIFCYKN